MEIHRKTKQVQQLLEYFDEQPNAVSTSDLITRFKPEMNRTTVYRILGRMEEDGIIHSFNGPDGATWYASCKECDHHNHSDVHPHFKCNTCGAVECLEIKVVIPNVPNYKIEHQQVMLTGECKVCLN